MLLKFTHNMRVDKDGNISISSEQIVDSESEADEAGAAFRKMMIAFLAGYGREEESAP